MKFKPKALENNTYEREYLVDIPYAILSSTTEESSTDPTISARIYIYQSYETTFNGDTEYAKVFYYKGKWVNLDTTVTCPRIEIMAHVNGESILNGVQLNTSETAPRTNPVSGTYYQNTPSWAGTFYMINDIYVQQGRTTAYLKRGNTNWSFAVNVCAGGSFATCK